MLVIALYHLQAFIFMPILVSRMFLMYLTYSFQAEIRRLREANKAAARERQKHLYEEIAKKRQQSTVEVG